jgi:hypothetical protein
MANICRGLRKFFFSPVLKLPTHIGFIDVKKWDENLTLHWAHPPSRPGKYSQPLYTTYRGKLSILNASLEDGLNA